MTFRLLPARRRRVAAVLTAVAAVVAFGSWALWPVHDPSCVVYSGVYVPVDASQAETDAIVRREHDKALADAACGSGRARFRDWTR